MTDHESASHTLRERLFKELLSTFFIEFLELFIPDLAGTVEPDSMRFLQQEYFVDLTSGEEKVIDLLVDVEFHDRCKWFHAFCNPKKVAKSLVRREFEATSTVSEGSSTINAANFR